MTAMGEMPSLFEPSTGFLALKEIINHILNCSYVLVYITLIIALLAPTVNVIFS